MDKNLLHYDALMEFKRQFYADLLTHENLQGKQVHFPKAYGTDGEQDTFDFWGYILEKGGRSFLLSSTDADGKEIVPSSILPIRAKHVEKIANKGTVYFHINSPVSVKFRPKKHMEFKELVDYLCSFSHDNPTHQKLFWFLTLTQLYSRANFRVATPAGFGKDSVVDIIGNLVGGAGTIENPSIAKLEERATVLKLLALNEVVDIAKPEWRIIEHFLLATGAFKPEVTKRTRANDKVGEVIDISNFSLSLLYNDIDHYPVVDNYLDFVTKKAVLDRFPSFRLYGRLNEDFNHIQTLNIPRKVESNLDTYRAIIETFTYYQKNILNLQNNYSKDKLKKYSERWSTNINRLLGVVDIYCDTQEEFDGWVNVINKSIQDYRDMIKYPELMDKLKDKSGEAYKREEKYILNIPTFTEKVDYLKLVLSGNKPVRDTKPLSEYDGEIL